MPEVLTARKTRSPAAAALLAALAAENGLERLTISLPLGAARDARLLPPTVQINVRLYDGAAAAFLRALDGLRADHTLLRNGRHVQALGDVVRWLVEQVAE